MLRHRHHLNVVKQRFGVEVVEVELPIYTGTESVSEQDYVKAFRKALNAHSNVKLIVFSHITYKTGTRLPAKKICKLAKKYAVPTLGGWRAYHRHDGLGFPRYRL